MFLALGALCEVRWPRRFAVCVVTSALTISAALSCLQPEVELYRGLSGIDSALFTLAVVCLIREAIAERRLAFALPLVASLLGLLGKILYEYATGTTLFVNSTGAFVPIPLAHLAGSAVGLIVACSGLAQRSSRVVRKYRTGVWASAPTRFTRRQNKITRDRS